MDAGGREKRQQEWRPRGDLKRARGGASYRRRGAARRSLFVRSFSHAPAVTPERKVHTKTRTVSVLIRDPWKRRSYAINQDA
jgi:hypothetical protein